MANTNLAFSYNNPHNRSSRSFASKAIKQMGEGREEELKQCTLFKTQLGWGFNTWMLRSIFCFAEWELESHFHFCFFCLPVILKSFLWAPSHLKCEARNLLIIQLIF